MFFGEAIQPRIVPVDNFTFSIGADPEVFFEKDGLLYSAEGLVGGTKKKPKQITNEISVQEDNVAAEFNVYPYLQYKMDGELYLLDLFQQRIERGLEYLVEVGKKHGLSISSRSSGLFNPEQLKTEQAMLFGCDPDINAWTGEINPPPEPPPLFRSAGGHIHVGFPATELTKGLKWNELIKWMDLYLGVPSILEDPDKERRQIYGKAGSFRVTPYGVEYRVLSNYWIFSTQHIENVISRTVSAINVFHKGKTVGQHKTKLSKNIQRAINTNNTQIARSLCTAWHVPGVKKAA